MRIFKGLENIHAVIDRHDNEWRKQQGIPEVPEYTPNEEVRRRWDKAMKKDSGPLKADRFLNKGKTEGEAEAPELETVEPIKQDGTQHSWLYNEIRKAVEDAVGNSRKNTKVIAIFVPVIQNTKEFEELPVDESVTLPPVPEEIPVEDDTIDFDIVVDEDNEPDEVVVIEAPQKNLEPENLEQPSTDEDFNDDEEFQEPELLEEAAPVEEEAEAAEENHDFDLIPEAQEHPDEELAEAFNTMEEKFEEKLAEASEELELSGEEENNNEEIIEFEAEAEEIPETAPVLEEKETNSGDSLDSFRESDPEIPDDNDGDLENFEPAEEIPEEFNEPESLPEIDEVPDLMPESEPIAGEAMSFEEIPVIKEDENEIAQAPEDFIEEVKPEEVKEAKSKKSEYEEKKKDDALDPPTLEDFDDEEVFEEPLEMLDETSELEYGDELDDVDTNENIRLDV